MAPAPEQSLDKTNANGRTNEFFATVPRRVILHRIETGECLDERLFWAVVLWSWCGPKPTEFATVRDSRGFVQVASTATPVAAKYNDFIHLINLGPGAKGAVSRAFSRLENTGAIRRDEDGRIYPVKEPKPLKTADAGDDGPAPRIFHIGVRTVSSDQYRHLSPEVREKLESDLEFCSTRWLADLKTLRTSYSRLLDQTLSDAGIIIGLDKQNRREEEASSSSPVQECPEVETTTDAPPDSPRKNPDPPRKNPDPPETPSLEEPAPAAQTDVQTIAAGIGCDPDAARLLLRATRQRRPDATAAEIVRAAFWKVKQLTGRREKIGNMVGMLIRAIPNMAEGDNWLEIRREVQRE